MSPGLQHVNTYAPVKDEEDSVGAPHTSGTPMSRVSSASVKWAQHAAKQRPSMIGYVLGATLLLLLSIPLLSRAKDPWDVSDRLLFNQGGPRASQWDTRARSKVYRPRDLLSKYAPSPNYLDSLRPDIRYLTCDSWSGLTGQFLTVLSLLHLASLTQRVAVIPSWRDDGHYGDVVANMGMLFDMEKFREQTGLLFVEMDDLKPNIKVYADTPLEVIGCHKGSYFENAVNFRDHNLHMDVYDVRRPGDDNVVWSYESYVLFDYQYESRHEATHQVANVTQRILAPNMEQETADGGLLCYTNLWDLKHAGGGLSKDHPMHDMLPDPLKGDYIEWQTIGRYIDFVPAVWDIAIAVARQTLGVKGKLPPLLTVHIRRGDFKSWCAAGKDCVPGIDAYAPAVERMLALSPPGTRVLCTTDETEDLDYLAGFERLGWTRVDHLKLGTEAVLREQFGVYSRWADGAVDQAILSLGSNFVGTEGSQVSLVSAMRVRSWNDGRTEMVLRTG